MRLSLITYALTRFPAVGYRAARQHTRWGGSAVGAVVVGARAALGFVRFWLSRGVRRG